MPDRIPPSKAAVLMAVAHGASSINEVQDQVHLGRSTTWRWLNELRNEGWIIWPPDTEGTLRPNFAARIYP